MKRKTKQVVNSIQKTRTTNYTRIQVKTKKGSGVIETDCIKIGNAIKREFKVVRSGTK